MTSNNLTPEQLRSHLRKLGLYGLLAHFDEIHDQPWLPQVIRFEDTERQRRGLTRRLHNARLGAFKPLADFDWSFPRQIDRHAIDELYELQFLEQGLNVIFVGPNGVGKTTLLKNIVHHAIVHGHTARFVSASDMLADLAAQDSSAALTRRLRHYTSPKLLGIDEIGYLAYSNRYADLLFQVITRRYDTQKPILVSTNKAFNDWAEVFPNAACIVTLVDRLVHRSEIIEIDGDSYRLKEAKEHRAKRSASRRRKKPAA